MGEQKQKFQTTLFTKPCQSFSRLQYVKEIMQLLKYAGMYTICYPNPSYCKLGNESRGGEKSKRCNFYTSLEIHIPDYGYVFFRSCGDDFRSSGKPTFPRNDAQSRRQENRPRPNRDGCSHDFHVLPRNERLGGQLVPDIQGGMEGWLTAFMAL